MSLIRYHKRNNLFWKIIYLSGIILIIAVVLNLLNFQSLFTADKDISKKLSQKISKNNEIQNTELVLHNSIFKGVTQDLEPYKITASTANKVAENQYALNDVGANYLVKNSNLLINAKNGTLDNSDNWMELSNDVQILFNNLLLNTSQMYLNLVNKEVLSETNVKVTYKNSQVNADSFSSTSNNGIINFRGNVKTILNLDDF